MKITITPTEKLISQKNLDVEAIPRMVRVWEGVSEKGARCLVLVAGVCAPTHQDQTELERRLREFIPRERDREVIDLRHIL